MQTDFTGKIVISHCSISGIFVPILTLIKILRLKNI